MQTAARPRRTLTAALTAAGLALSLSACGGVTDGTDDADGFPDGPITLTVGQDAGGSTDLIARAVANGSQDSLGVAMPVENQPGANGAIATQQVADQSPDGYDLVLLNASLITITSLIAAEDEEVDLDELDVLMGLSRDDYVMVAHADTGYETLEDVAAESGDVSYGTAGIGTGSQLAQLLLFGEADIEGNEVPFDGGGPALTALMGGQVDVATVQVAEAMPQIEAGTVNPVVVFSDERLDFLPETPTALEEGYDIPVAQYRAVAMPAGASDEVKATLEDGFQEIVDTEEYQQFNEDNYLTPVEISGDEVEEQWNELAETYRQLVEDNDIDLGGTE
ncbi:tripartite tricarboxylate transporter substrate binding protein [Nesterenkonia xinjiangensis]|uniref:Tripartite-type tricarboxylate transporter receptor subunit TctC n=1 Tax=Nesterenkonia xinjiangensis TaxID=225327 RepID=A0A7Z0K9H3_9MICC|nr:tripartite tricarboxylate transporter substrate binding protein [Nesterenkonia xinjiangensis]NYJ77808.1 tripartite-type tricarboxylate transporter receptor subunit TctC [Nesterenkonia xinjiangensis]